VVSESLAQDGGDDGVPPRAAPDQVPRPRKRKPSGAPYPARDAKYELTDEDREWARRTVASLPPLTDRQRDVLALLLRKHR
jgi:hypothetical protein